MDIANITVSTALIHPRDSAAFSLSLVLGSTFDLAVAMLDDSGLPYALPTGSTGRLVLKPANGTRKARRLEFNAWSPSGEAARRLYHFRAKLDSEALRNDLATVSSASYEAWIEYTVSGITRQCDPIPVTIKDSGFQPEDAAPELQLGTIEPVAFSAEVVPPGSAITTGTHYAGPVNRGGVIYNVRLTVPTYQPGTTVQVKVNGTTNLFTSAQALTGENNVWWAEDTDLALSSLADGDRLDIVATVATGDGYAVPAHGLVLDIAMRDNVQSEADAWEKLKAFIPESSSVTHNDTDKEIEITGGGGSAAWADITGKPSTFAPSAHASSHGSGGSDPITIAQSQVTGLTTVLAGKADTSHIQAISTITDLQTTLDAKAPLSGAVFDDMPQVTGVGALAALSDVSTEQSAREAADSDINTTLSAAVTDIATNAGNIATNTSAISAINTAIGTPTPIGKAILNLTNPSAIRFLRINADNTPSALSDTDMRTALGLGTMATQAASAVAITGGTATALTNFGLSLANNTALNDLSLGAITDTTSRPLNIKQTWNNAGLTAVGLCVDITNTASNSNSRGFAVKINGSTVASVGADGYVYANGILATASTSYFSNLSLSGIIQLPASSNAYIGTNGGFPAYIMLAAAEGTNYSVAIKNSTNACKLRVYGSTTGPKYLQIEHDGTNAKITASSGSVLISNLPTSNPGPGILWNNAGTPAIGT